MTTEYHQQILDFLDYAKINYQVNPTAFQEGFVCDHIGPKVMEDLGISDLAEYHAPCGDIHHLKRAACAWEEEAHVTKASFIEEPEEVWCGLGMVI